MQPNAFDTNATGKATIKKSDFLKRTTMESNAAWNMQLVVPDIKTIVDRFCHCFCCHWNACEKTSSRILFEPKIGQQFFIVVVLIPYWILICKFNEPNKEANGILMSSLTTISWYRKLQNNLDFGHTGCCSMID